MTKIARTLRPVRLAGLALGMLAAPLAVVPAGAHEVYPPGWNATGATTPEAYSFRPDSNQRHRVTTAAPQETAAAPAGDSGVRYQFVPGSNHRHSVQ